VISVVGIAAMIWVGGHILLVGTNDLGWHAPYALVHHLEVAAHDSVEAVGAVLGWLVNTAGSALVGLLVGAVVVTVVQLLPFGHERPASDTAPTDES
jgi:predicted DNA repair protein MutK